MGKDYTICSVKAERSCKAILLTPTVGVLQMMKLTFREFTGAAQGHKARGGPQYQGPSQWKTVDKIAYQGYQMGQVEGEGFVPLSSGQGHLSQVTGFC